MFSGPATEGRPRPLGNHREGDNLPCYSSSSSGKARNGQVRVRRGEYQFLRLTHVIHQRSASEVRVVVDLKPALFGDVLTRVRG